jgi:hypothetical protein
MTTRSRRETVHFKRPFRIRGVDRLLPAGAYEVVTDEEMIEGLSFPCFRRVATMIMVPGASLNISSMEMISISSVDLSDGARCEYRTSPSLRVHFQQEGLTSFFIQDIGAFHDLAQFERLLAERTQDIFSIIQHY